MTRFLAFSGALFASVLLINKACAADNIYQSTDKRGNPVFTDRPQPNAKPVELPPINTTPSLESTTPGMRPPPNAFAGYSRISIGVPSSIPNGLAPTTIGIDLQPVLQPSHRWQLLLDGSLVEEGSSGSVTIERMERGPHRFELRVLDERGQVIGAPAMQEVFVYWPGGKNK